MNNKHRRENVPYSQEAEQSVLGALMMPRGSDEAWDAVDGKLTKEDFYRYDHAMIFDSICELKDESKQTDFISVAEHVSRKGLIDKVGGSPYIQELARSVPSAHGIGRHAEIVKSNSIQRNLIDISTNIKTLASNPDGKKSNEIVDDARDMIDVLSNETAVESTKNAKDVLGALIEQIEERSENGDKLIGLDSGFDELNDMLNGICKPDLVIVAGRPAMGKTTFAMNIAEQVAIKDNKDVLVFSLEMSAEQIMSRTVCSIGTINGQNLLRADMTDGEWNKVTKATAEISKSKIEFNDTPALQLSELRSIARRQKKKGLDLIVVDYLQLLRFGGTNARHEEISEISRGLKALAKELNIPIIALSQLSRNLEQRPNKRPIMSDLRESGSIEQDADIIIFLYRDEVYNEETPDAGFAEIIIAKHRNGRIGTIKVRFEGQYFRFRNLKKAEREFLDDASAILEDDDDYGTEGYYKAEEQR